MKRLLIIFIICILFFLTACSRIYEKQDFAMGTIITQKVYGKREVMDKVMDKIKDIEKRMSLSIASKQSLNNRKNTNSTKYYSEIDCIAMCAGDVSYPIHFPTSWDTAYVIKTAIKYSELSNGTFDVTVAPLVAEWNVTAKEPKVPSKQRIQELLKLVGYKTIFINDDDKKNHIGLLFKGQAIDLGGIAKGFAADEARKIYLNNRVKSAILNIGGNIITIGRKDKNTRWKIGIQNPRAANGEYIGTLEVEDKAISSSGDYQRYFEKDNVRYHHIIDPRTGYPARSGLISTTIIAPKSIDADALSTATFVMGLDKGMKLVETIKNTEGIFITEDKNIFVTSGLRGKFKFDDKSGEYKYVEKR